MIVYSKMKCANDVNSEMVGWLVNGSEFVGN